MISILRMRRWLLVAATIVIAAAVFLPRILLVLSFSAKALGYPGALDYLRGPVSRNTINLSGVPADIYASKSPTMGLLVVHGVNPTGKDDSSLMRVADGLAQAGFYVMVPDFAGMKRQQVRPEGIEAVKAAFLRLDLPSGILCFSYGCGPALMAAASDELRQRVAFVFAFGGYFDLVETLEFVITEHHGPIGYSKWFFMAQNADLVETREDQHLLREICMLKLENTDIPSALIEKLSVQGSAILNFLEAKDSAEFRKRFADLPPKMRTNLEQLSPSSAMTGLRARLIIGHGYSDPSIPYVESVRLAEAAKRQGIPYSLTLLNIYGHVHPIWPEVTLRNIFKFYIPEGWKLLRLADRLLSYVQ